MNNWKDKITKQQNEEFTRLLSKHNQSLCFNIPLGKKKKNHSKMNPKLAEIGSQEKNRKKQEGFYHELDKG